MQQYFDSELRNLAGFFLLSDFNLFSLGIALPGPGSFQGSYYFPGSVPGLFSGAGGAYKAPLNGVSYLYFS